eukprot:TRINITY_DN5990_c0_g1_i1.p1 TRINITY_DN5990_c0_g1~~TRINITY_DN5990_c0_g1_i1.p1  ORF type:complete len:130 (-),score=29.31 TRINITY_DN5990_c0_g1_i1:27-416(-)
MWQTGLIYGFLSREGVNAILSTQTWGTFLIRFSEKNPGSFAVGYVTNTVEKVRHYLIRPEDVPAKKTIADFLSESLQFSQILQVKYDPKTGVLQQRTIEKNLALEAYLPKKTRDNTPIKDGYDQKLVIG